MSDFEKVVDKDTAEQDAMKMLKGQFTFNDFIKQINMIRKMGSMRSIMEKIPGMGDLMSQLPPEALDDREFKKVEAIIQSMTKQERNNPDVVNDSRMTRIARGCGRPLDEVKELYKRFDEMRSMMSNMGNSGMFAGMPGMPGGRAQRRQMKNAGDMGGMAPGGGMMGGMNPFGGMPSGGASTMSGAEKAAAAKKKRAERKARKKSRKRK